MFLNHHNYFYVRSGFPHCIFHQTGNEKAGIGEMRRFNVSNIYLFGLEKEKYSVSSSFRLGHHQQKQHYSRTVSLRMCKPPIYPYSYSLHQYLGLHHLRLTFHVVSNPSSLPGDRQNPPPLFLQRSIPSILFPQDSLAPWHYRYPQ